MVYVITSNDEFQELKTKLIAEIKGLENEINRQHLPSYHIIERKIQLINSTLDTIEANPNMTMQELSDLIDYRIESEETELDDISRLSDSSFEGVRQFDEEYVTMGVGTIISSVTSRVAGFPAQKITYTEPGVGNDEFRKMEVNIIAYDREYKIIYDTSNEKYYGKYLSTFQKMLNTFTVSKPNFEGIHC